jgi:hypothetical protein
MKRHTAVLILPLTLMAALAQDAKKEDKKEAAPAPAASTEQVWSGLLDVGFRGLLGFSGNDATYRSVVNLGEGWRVNALELHYQEPANRFVDTLNLQARSWGGDPYNTARMNIGKKGFWRLDANYSNIAYYNFLPSFANPLLDKGSMMDQRSYDTLIRNFNSELTFFPGSRIEPYLIYEQNNDQGTGITPLITDVNQYPIRNVVNWNQWGARAGVRLQYNKWSGTFEGGGTSFRDDQYVYSTGTTSGNRTTPYMGQSLFLSNGQQFYNTRSSGSLWRGFVTATPWNWLDLTGRILYSQPSTTVSFSQWTAGKDVLVNSGYIYFATQAHDLAYGNAKMPRTGISGSATIHAGSRLRIMESFETERYHTSSTSALNTSTTVTTGQTILGAFTGFDRLEVEINRQQVEAQFDASRNLMFRGGWRYDWGNTLARTVSTNPVQPYERAEMERNVLLLGSRWRIIKGVTFTADYEGAEGSKTFYRTGLMDYNRARGILRWTPRSDFLVSAQYAWFNNENPQPTSKYSMQSQQANGSIQWLPNQGKRFSVLADYTYSMIKSDISTLWPDLLIPVQSRYRDYASTGTLLADWIMPSKGFFFLKIQAGGSFVYMNGSRATRYYQPLARLVAPMSRKVHAYAEWRYYGYTEPMYTYEAFRTNMVMVGLRFML